MNKAGICIFPLSTRSEKNNLSEECNEFMTEIQKIIVKSESHDEAKKQILELFSKIELTKDVYEQKIMQAYLKYNVDLLDYLATNISRISLVQYLWQYNDPELSEPLTRNHVFVDLPGVSDGVYGVGNGEYYIVSKGVGLFRRCAQGLYFYNSCVCCNFPDYEDSSWKYWAKCFASIIAGATVEGLGGALAGSALPGVGTAVGGGIGAVGGALAGFVV